MQLKQRKMNAPRLAIGDGAMGFWAALAEFEDDESDRGDGGAQSFATIRHRTKRSEGCLTRDGMLHML